MGGQFVCITTDVDGDLTACKLTPKGIAFFRDHPEECGEFWTDWTKVISSEGLSLYVAEALDVR